MIAFNFLSVRQYNQQINVDIWWVCVCVCDFYITELMDKIDHGSNVDNKESPNKLNMESKAAVLQKDVSMLLGRCAVERDIIWFCFSGYSHIAVTYLPNILPPLVKFYLFPLCL